MGSIYPCTALLAGSAGKEADLVRSGLLLVIVLDGVLPRRRRVVGRLIVSSLHL